MSFLGGGAFEIGFKGLNKAPKTAHCKIMHAQIDMANRQPNASISLPTTGANTNEPTPLPAMRDSALSRAI